MSSELIWQLVKKNNAFLKRNVNGTIWSSEPGNLANKNSYKYSGLANLKSTVGVTEAEGAVAVQTSSKKRAGKLSTTLVKKNARRASYAAGAMAAIARPDLKDAAKARASQIARALRTRKAKAASA